MAFGDGKFPLALNGRDLPDGQPREHGKRGQARLQGFGKGTDAFGGALDLDDDAVGGVAHMAREPEAAGYPVDGGPKADALDLALGRAGQADRRC